MRRRDFIAGLAGAGAFPPRLSLPSRAAAAARHYRIGVLETSPPQRNANFSALKQALRERGYVEGPNLTFEYRSAEGNNAGFARLAQELAGLTVDVIVTRGTPAALAAKAATTTIPVVMAAAGDPEAIAHGAPEAGNLTGFGAYVPGIEGQRIEILRDMLPGLARIAALTNLSNPSRQAEWREIEAAARSSGIEAQVLDTPGAADIEPAFVSASSLHADALLVGSDTLIQTNQSRIVGLAAVHRMPAMYTFRDFVEAGGLVSYGVSLPDLFRRAAGYVDDILAGTPPNRLPIEQPRRLELVVNLKAARAIGLAIPDQVLHRADEAIG